MNKQPLDIVILGLSITSSWGNGHATTYRGLVRELSANGHHITFLERDVPWYASNRDISNTSYCKTILYNSEDDLKEKYRLIIQDADLVIVGSYVPDGVAIGKFVLKTARGVTAFYDIDTPVTLAKMEHGDFEYIHPSLIAKYNMYLSFTGGAILSKLEKQYGAPMARALYCSFDPELYYPESHNIQWDLGYLGTYSADRQPSLQKLMLDAAAKLPGNKFVVAGPQYSEEIKWPANVQYVNHLPPAAHRKFYNSQRFTLNITRADMITAGYSPSVRLFEAAACGTPIISDYWTGIDHFFKQGSEILISKSAEDTIGYLTNISEEKRREIGESGRKKVLQYHTAAHRARELEDYYYEALDLKHTTPERVYTNK